MSLLPIVKGCRAIVLSTDHSNVLKPGDEVTVVEYLGNVHVLTGGTVPDAWEVDWPEKPVPSFCAAQKSLMRIDGHKDEEEFQEAFSRWPDRHALVE